MKIVTRIESRIPFVLNYVEHTWAFLFLWSQLLFLFYVLKVLAWPGSAPFEFSLLLDLLFLASDFV